MKQLHKNFLQAFLAGVCLCNTFLPSIAHAQAVVQTPDQIDLVQDANGDSIPDALATEIDNIRTLAEGVQVTASEIDQQAAQNALESAIENFGQRLPYSAQTRELQQRMNKLSIEIGQATESATIDALQQEMAQIDQQMMADPNYAVVINSLPRLLGIGEVSTPVESSLTRRVYLPFVSSNSNTSVTRISNTSVDTGKIAQHLTQISAAAVTAGASFSRLIRGDIMFIRSGDFNTFFYAMTYSHTGSYDGNNSVYESNPNGGVQLRSLRDWKKSGQYVGLAYNKRTTYSQDLKALDWAKNKWGDKRTSYNYWFIDKNTDSTLYCSQLVWRIQKYSNVDVDSNHWTYMVWMTARYWWLFGLGTTAAVYMMVAPDEIALDDDITIYSTGTNP